MSIMGCLLQNTPLKNWFLKDNFIFWWPKSVELQHLFLKNIVTKHLHDSFLESLFQYKELEFLLKNFVTSE